MMLAKLIGCPISTQLPSVRKPDSTTGASVKATSFASRSTTNSRPLTSTSARIPASTNAHATVPAASCVATGRPLAVGATARTALVKRRSTALSLLLPLGNTWTSARPSFDTQSPAISGGSVARVTGSAWSVARIWSSIVPSGVTSSALAFVRSGGAARARRSNAVASRRASAAAAPGCAVALARSSPATFISAATDSASLGGGVTSNGLTAASSSKAASCTTASLAG